MLNEREILTLIDLSYDYEENNTKDDEKMAIIKFEGGFYATEGDNIGYELLIYGYNMPKNKFEYKRLSELNNLKHEVITDGTEIRDLY